MLTYKFFVTKSGKLALRLRNNNKKTEINLIHSTTQQELDKILSPASKRIQANTRLKMIVTNYIAILNRICSDMIEEGRTKEDVLTTRKVVEVKFGLIEEPEPTATGNFEKHFVKFMESKKKDGTKAVYAHTLSRMRLFDPQLKDRSFEDIDLKWLTDFDAFLSQTSNKNARNIHLRNIRAVFNNAIDFDITQAYPFRRFKIRPEVTRKRSLSVDDLRKLFSYAVEPYAEIYRDMFKLIFMLIGINTVDLCRLKCITDGRIEYKRAKTGRPYSIKVEPEAFELIQKYQGTNGLLCVADRWSDHRNFRRQCNKALQSIGKVERKGRGGKKEVTAEWPELTTYWARHSWATIAYNECGISKDVIAQALGHSDGHDTTSIYINESLAVVDAANRQVLDWVLYGKRQ